MKADNYKLYFDINIEDCVMKNFDLVKIYKYVQDNS